MSTPLLDITIDGGKYRLVQDEHGGLRAYRYGEEWRSCYGDKLILSLAQEIAKLRAALAQQEPKPQPASGSKVENVATGDQLEARTILEDWLAEGWQPQPSFTFVQSEWLQQRIIRSLTAARQPTQPTSDGIEHLANEFERDARAKRAACSGGDGTERGWAEAETLIRCAARLRALPQPPQPPGMNWELSDKTKNELAEIDRFTGLSQHEARNIVCGSTQPTAQAQRDSALAVANNALQAKLAAAENVLALFATRALVLESADDANIPDSKLVPVPMRELRRARSVVAAHKAVKRGVPVVYLREIDAGTDNACWVVCSNVDPGAKLFVMEVML